jgi:hypothetical protein
MSVGMCRMRHTFSAEKFQNIRSALMKGLILTAVVLLVALLSLRMAWADPPRTGTWRGYYLYSSALDPHSVHQTMDLTFTDGEVSGAGKDDEVGAFTI